MKHTVFTGVATALVTPFNADGSVNYERFAAYCAHQQDAGVSALVVAGTTGEGSTLEPWEHMELTKTAKKSCALPVIAAISSNCTRKAVQLAKNARNSGADAVLALTPYYNKTTPTGLVRHFSEIAAACELPVILYNVPTRTTVCIPRETYIELSKTENIVAVKDANPSVSDIVRYISACGDALALYSGNDELTVPLMSIGALGAISVVSNIAPSLVVSMCALALHGDFAAASAIQLKLSPLIDALFSEVNPIPVKYAMNHMGLCAGPCRLPLVELSRGNRPRLEALLSGID